MAVNRVILQHFSMKYDYMTKERPNIYQPSSRAKFQLGESDDDIEIGVPACETSSTYDTAIDAVAVVDNYDNNDDLNSSLKSLSLSTAATKTTNDITTTTTTTSSKQTNLYCGSNSTIVAANNIAANTSIITTTADTNQISLSSNGLDSINELKEKLPKDKLLLSTYNNKLSARDDVALVTAAAAKNVSTTTSSAINNKMENGGFYKTNFSNLRPEDNWRYRSITTTTTSSLSSCGIDDKMPIGFRNYRNFNTNAAFINSNNNNNINNHNINNNNRSITTTITPQWRKQQQIHNDYQSSHSTKDTSNGIQIRNWRKECMTNASSRNCAAAVVAAEQEAAAAAAAALARRDSDTSDTSGENVCVGLSPPSESLLMQRRMRLMSRSSDIPLRGPPPATASG